jgi:hypothetical protein
MIGVLLKQDNLEPKEYGITHVAFIHHSTVIQFPDCNWNSSHQLVRTVSCMLEREGNINIGKISGLMELSYRLTLRRDWNNIRPESRGVHVINKHS